MRDVMLKKTGYLVANIHQGTALRMWDAINEDVRLHNDQTVFIFPGGRLNYKKADEYLRNSIFQYANERNLDGAVVWSSSLAGEATWKSVHDWTKKLSLSLPVVSLGISIEGVPSITFDAYSGVYRMVEHFISFHGLKRIAFLRGPEKHDSALERYRAYIDALKDYSIEIDNRLISSPQPWSEGETAIKEIVETNHMMPKRDFDAVITSSDLMAYTVENYLEKNGYIIPDDIAIAGFNDSPEAFMGPTELSTVRTPIKEMVEHSSVMINRMEEREKEFPSSISLITTPIFRRSCGCSDIYSTNEVEKIKSFKDYEEWLKIRINDEKCASILLEIVNDLFVKRIVVNKESRRHFEELSWRYLKHGGEIKLFLSAIKLCGVVYKEREFSSLETYLLSEILMESEARVSATNNYKRRERNTTHNAFANKLLKVHSFEEMGEIMKKYFPPMGIEKAFIFTYKENGSAVLQCGFSQDKLFTRGKEFSSSLLYPEELESEIERGLFVVNPLFFDNEIEGYMIIKNNDSSAIMIENIRTDVSASLQAISLYSLACEKSQRAEEAEKKTSEFYAILSEELREPLKYIKDLLLSKKDFDREKMLSTIIKSEHLLQLSIAEKGGLVLEAKLHPLSKLIDKIREKGIKVSSPSMLPSLVMDEQRMEDVLDSVISYFSNEVELMLRLEEADVSLHFSSLRELSQTMSNATLQYVEKLLLLHGGNFSFDNDGLTIYLPYPTISGESSIENKDGGVLFITDNSSKYNNLFSCKVTYICFEEAIQAINSVGSYSSISWDTSEINKQNGIVINLLRSHKDGSRLPFISFGLKDDAISLNAALEGVLPSEGKGSIYTFGHFPSSLSIFKEFASIEEVKDLKDIPDEAKSSLFVLSSVDNEKIEAIRKDRSFTKTPILIVKDRFTKEEAESLASTPSVLLVNTSITEAEGFINRIVSIFAGEELLPPLTSVLVKKAIAYINDNATNSISRWQIAGSVNISEDYLTRIFRKEIGISPWDYLNRYRIQIASRLLLETGSSISEIASLTGFQDQAYFCRVFRKVKGFPPGNIRTR